MCSPQLQGSRGQDRSCTTQDASGHPQAALRLSLTWTAQRVHFRHLLQPAAPPPLYEGINSDGSEASGPQRQMDAWDWCMQDPAADNLVHASDPCRLLLCGSWQAALQQRRRQPAIQPVLGARTWQVACQWSATLCRPRCACRPLHHPRAARWGLEPCAGHQTAACASHPRRDVVQPHGLHMLLCMQVITFCMSARRH